MGLNCGIVGLPNVGKSTLFCALTSVPAEAANYPYSTVEPNIGIIDIPDERLYKIAELIPPKKIIPATVEFVDIAGLAKGASRGEGLGNQFLSQIRQMGIIVQVVRCFEDPDVVHVSQTLDPESDIESVNIELAIADLETVEKQIQRTEKNLKSANKDMAKEAQGMMPILELLKSSLGEGKPARLLDLSEEQEKLIYDMHLITRKKQLLVANVDENHLSGDSPLVMAVERAAAALDTETVVICAKLESEIALLETAEERKEFLASAGLSESGLSRLIHTGYRMLGLRTYFTAGEPEARAWTFHEGAKAPEAAGVIHTDFQKGFIKAEVYHCTDLFELGSEQKIKQAGKLRLEGKEYVVKDGDVMHFRFNA
ncbi:MAG: redox-regulated ATPase YchF [Spirochaetales bacterium]|nr:MAG: redox-regulated ATPase YchF [Spirochaetales bacterium]